MRIQNHNPTIVVTADDVAAALTAHFRDKLDGRQIGNLRNADLQRRQLLGSPEAWVGEFTFELTTESK